MVIRQPDRLAEFFHTLTRRKIKDFSLKVKIFLEISEKTSGNRSKHTITENALKDWSRRNSI